MSHAVIRTIPAVIAVVCAVISVVLAERKRRRALAAYDRAEDMFQRSQQNWRRMGEIAVAAGYVEPEMPEIHTWGHDPDDPQAVYAFAITDPDPHRGRRVVDGDDVATETVTVAMTVPVPPELREALAVPSLLQLPITTPPSSTPPRTLTPGEGN